MEVNKKIARSNKIYPFFAGLSSDLMFWAAINTLFLTTVKNLSAAQISSLISIGMLSSILSNFICLKIIKKIGNINSVRLGVILLFISSLIITFSNSYIFILIGQIIYQISFTFKTMDSIILRKNLKYGNKVNSYIRIQNKVLMVYSTTTMIISFLSGFIFNINPYLPMIIGIIFCIINIILSGYLYEVDIEDDEKQTKSKNVHFSKIATYSLLLFGITYSIIELSQTNGKLFIQYNLANFLNTDKVAIILTSIITVSRIIRVLSMIIFDKIYNKLKKKIIVVIETILILGLLLIIFASFLDNTTIKIILMAIGFCCFLASRDPIESYLKTTLLNHCHKDNHQEAINYFGLSRKIGNFVISTLITLLLLKLDLIFALIFLFTITLLNLIVIKKLYQCLKY